MENVPYKQLQIGFKVNDSCILTAETDIKQTEVEDEAAKTLDYFLRVHKFYCKAFDKLRLDSESDFNVDLYRHIYEDIKGINQCIIDIAEKHENTSIKTSLDSITYFQN